MATEDYKPDVADVAALEQARLEQRGGGKASTFDETTSPTGEQVESLCVLASREVSKRIGAELCADAVAAGLADDAKAAAALYAAMLIETSYYPEQTRHEGSAFRSHKALWDDAIKSLTEAVGEVCGTGSGSAVGGAGPSPAAFFDDREILGPNGPEW